MAGKLFMGRYETIRLLGEGGMGRVYLAWQTDLGRQVVIKVMHESIAAEPRFRDRFSREMLMMARFQHPNVVSLYDASLNDPNGPCIVMEFIKGVTLEKVLQKNQRLHPGRVDRLLGQLCEALTAAHKEGIVHRDLKPANIMVVDADSPYEMIKVMDFGLAKLVAGRNSGFWNNQKPLTNHDCAVGTPGYIAPEQVRGVDSDFRCDIYSVGVMLFEMITGKLPFIRKETMDVLMAHVSDQPPSFEEVGAPGCVSAEVEAIVQRCLAKEPADRPTSARDLAQEFHAALVHYFQTEEEVPPSANGSHADAPPEEEAKPDTSFNSNVIVHVLEAWMPDTIAAYKLKGFIHDHQCQVLDSRQGFMRFRLVDTASRRGPFGWLGLGPKEPTVDLDVEMQRTQPSQPNLLQIKVTMSSPEGKSHKDAWRQRSKAAFCELRSYLAGAQIS